MGKAQDMPVYFGDAGSNKVLHHVGAEKAACVVVVLDSPAANYRCVWGMRRYFPNVKIYVRAYDMDHARSLEKAGATVVIPETLEPSLQLAASVLSEVWFFGLRPFSSTISPLSRQVMNPHVCAP